MGYVHSACFEVEGHKQSVIGGGDVRGRDFHGPGGAGQKSMGRDGALGQGRGLSLPGGAEQMLWN